MHPLDAVTCAGYYERALQTTHASDWEAFYRVLFGSMKRVARSDAAVDANATSARAALMLILEDDLGLELFDRTELERLRRDLMEDLISL